MKNILFVFVGQLFIWNCSQSIEYHGRRYSLDSAEKNEIEQLVTASCGGCHLLPAPEELDRETWGYMLGYMGLYLGIEDTSTLKHDAGYIEQWKNRRSLLKVLGEIPPKPELSSNDWLKIKSWYLVQSPNSAPYHPSEPLPIAKDFRLQPLSVKLKERAVTLLRQIDDKFYIGTAWDSALYSFKITSKKNEVLADGFRRSFPSPPVDIRSRGNGLELTLLGDLLGNRPLEKPAELWLAPHGKNWQQRLKNLPRASMMVPYEDGWLIPGFGVGKNGGVWLVKKNGERHQISRLAGAIGLVVDDLNHDTYRDVIVLFANSRESLRVFMRKPGPEARFEETILDEFSATCGFTRMLYTDLTGDGQNELITVAGDNPDAGPYNPSKKCHGVRIYSLRRCTTGDQCAVRLKLKFYQPLSGAYDAVKVQFHDEQSASLIVTSFFPDISRENPIGLVHIRQSTPGHFASEVIPVEQRLSLAGLLRTPGNSKEQSKEEVVLAGVPLPLIQKKGEKVLRHEYRAGESGLFLLQKGR